MEVLAARFGKASSFLVHGAQNIFNMHRVVEVRTNQGFFNAVLHEKNFLLITSKHEGLIINFLFDRNL